MDFTRIVGVKLWKTGLLEIEREQVYPHVNRVPPKRSDGRRWSKKSQLRFIAKVAKGSSKMTSMITLTFPSRCPISDGRIAKKCLNRFLTNLRRRFPDCEYWWVQEFQKNGQPHFHLMVNLGGDKIDRLWLGRTWAQAIMYKPLTSWGVSQALVADIISVHKHPKAWQRLRHENGATRYLLSYVGKEAQKTAPAKYEHVGRFWGCSKGLSHELAWDEQWPIDDFHLREVLKEWGLDWVASWASLPTYVHTPRIL